jgi:ribonucrease Y
MAIDTKQIESFQMFLAWVSNPDASKQMLADLKKAADDLKTQNKIQDTITKADMYAAEKVKEVQKATEELQSYGEQIKQEKIAFEKIVALRKLEGDKREKELQAREAKLQEKEKELQEQVLEQVALNEQLTQREKEITARELHLAGVEDTLNAKAEALKKLLS